MSTASTLYDEANQLKVDGDLDGAVAKLHESLEANPEYALAHSALAVIEQKRGNFEQSVQHAEKATELEPNDPLSYTSLSIIYQKAYAGTGDTKYIQMAEDAMDKSRQIGQGM